ncbi:Ig-like domain-containing protein [Lysinibacillus sphaericus]|uniref:Ig-like domain-containing protein n=1 Tax=Lysinibacillus sphaericus TaxID=1421 RepID=UPI000C1A7DEF|nr:Ig-like domain-containing protein [Lysinibacillus sphaericus]PIJ96860.1 cell adhesion protein [Lysinibacillus sphaericus]
MVNLLKKSFIYLTLVLLSLVSFSVESASAAEEVDYEEGVTNLNNTPENSAVVGDVIKKPEIGWKRYDDSHESIKYFGNWSKYSASAYYHGSRSISGKNTLNDTVSFTFIGSKLRVISSVYPTYSNEISIKIDNVDYTFSQSFSNESNQVISYQNTALDYGYHTVEIQKIKNGTYGTDLNLDAIDVDGHLLAPGEIPNVQSITIDKNSIELLEGSQEKLTATVTPDTAKVIWTSSDESIATVDQNGNVTAIREGQAIVTATIENTDISATSTVIVKKPTNEFSNAILSITLVNGITKEYDVTNAIINNYLSWFHSAQGTSTFKFSKTISPYKKVTEYVVHDKIASFEIREY